MNWKTISFDWNQVRAFLATIEEGSLSAAARALGQTQPTLSRQITALEKSLGLTLFERGHRSMRLTQAGMELIDHVTEMGDAAARISLTATGQSQAIDGSISITASDAMSAFHLLPILKVLKERAPGIVVELIASNEVRDLNRREADIAIRHIRPDQPELIAKLVHQTTVHLYASTDYLDTYGRPANVDDLNGADFIGYEYAERLLPQLNDIGLSLTKNNFKYCTTSGVVMYRLIEQGFGIGLMPKEVAELTPKVEQVLEDLKPIPLPVWLVAHREIYTNRRIRIVYDLIAETFKKLSHS